MARAGEAGEAARSPLRDARGIHRLLDRRSPADAIARLRSLLAFHKIPQRHKLERLVDHWSLEASTLLLQGLETTGLIHLEAVVFPTPAVEGGLHDAVLAAELPGIRAPVILLRDVLIRLPIND